MQFHSPGMVDDDHVLTYQEQGWDEDLKLMMQSAKISCCNVENDDPQVCS